MNDSLSFPHSRVPVIVHFSRVVFGHLIQHLLLRSSLGLGGPNSRHSVRHLTWCGLRNLSLPLTIRQIHRVHPDNKKGKMKSIVFRNCFSTVFCGIFFLVSDNCHLKSAFDSNSFGLLFFEKKGISAKKKYFRPKELRFY